MNNPELASYIKEYRHADERRTYIKDRMIMYIMKNEISDEEIFKALLMVESNEQKARGMLKAIKNQVNNKRNL